MFEKRASMQREEEEEGRSGREKRRKSKHTQKLQHAPQRLAVDRRGVGAAAADGVGRAVNGVGMYSREPELRRGAAAQT